jgi:hypothetical protein
MLDLGQERSAIIENHRGRGRDAALEFGCGNPPTFFRRLALSVIRRGDTHWR